MYQNNWLTRRYRNLRLVHTDSMYDCTQEKYSIVPVDPRTVSPLIFPISIQNPHAHGSLPLNPFHSPLTSSLFYLPRRSFYHYYSLA